MQSSSILTGHDSVRVHRRVGSLARLVDCAWTHSDTLHDLRSLLEVYRSFRSPIGYAPLQRRHRNQLFLCPLVLFFLLLLPKVEIEEGVEVGQDKIVIIRKERVRFGIFEAIMEPVVTEARRRVNEVPPLIGEILDSLIGRHRDEDRSVGIQGRR